MDFARGAPLKTSWKTLESLAISIITKHFLPDFDPDFDLDIIEWQIENKEGILGDLEIAFLPGD